MSVTRKFTSQALALSKHPPGLELSTRGRAGSSDQLSMVCFICATHEPKYWAITNCNHRICHICALRMRALYETLACPMCKTICSAVIVRPELLELEYVQAKKEDWPFDPKLDLFFMNQNIRSELLRLLKQNCPVEGCGKTFSSKHELKTHISKAHGLLLCDICLEHKKAFAHEYVLYTSETLYKHQRENISKKIQVKGSVPQQTRSVAIHPPCQLCGGILFYGEDELQQHLRERHEICHICQRRGITNIHWRDYNALETHFRNAHYFCTEAVCVEMKFVVFAEEVEYRNHILEVHRAGENMQRAAQRQLRRLNFDFGEGRRREREREQGQERSRPQRAERSATEQETIPARTLSQPEAELPLQSAATIPPAPSFFGAVPGDIVGRLESLSLNNKLNADLLSALREEYRMSEGQIETIVKVCRQYQSNHTSVAELFTKLTSMLGEKNLKKIGTRLIDLQLRSQKKREMEQMLLMIEKKAHEFPSLPTIASVSSNASQAGPSTLRPMPIYPPDKSNRGRRILQIVPQKTIKATHLATDSKSSDPALNPFSARPSSRLSSSNPTPKEKALKTRPPLPSFTQAARGSQVGIVASQPARINPAGPSVDDSQFPSLPEKEKAAPIVEEKKTDDQWVDPFSGHQFIAEDRNRPDVFVVGGENADIDELPKSTTNKKRTKRQVVMRFG